MAVEQSNKCPACGALRASFTAICPECGYEFNDVKTSEKLENFVEKIEEYDRLIAEQQPAPKSGIGFWVIVAWIFLFPIMFGIFIIKRVKATHELLTGYEKLKAETISNFQVPNSRNDLIEFAILTQNKVESLNYFNALTDRGINIQRWNKIWRKKEQQIYEKAQIALKEDSQAKEKIAKCLQNSDETIRKNTLIQNIMIGGLLVIFLIIIISSCIK